MLGAPIFHLRTFHQYLMVYKLGNIAVLSNAKNGYSSSEQKKKEHVECPLNLVANYFPVR